MNQQTLGDKTLGQVKRNKNLRRKVKGPLSHSFPVLFLGKTNSTDEVRLNTTLEV